MNEDFEADLSRIPLRAAPASLRAEILRNASRAGAERGFWGSTIAGLFDRAAWARPHRLAFAGAWLVILLLRVVTPGSRVDEGRRAVTISAAHLQLMVREHQRWMSELLAPPAIVEPPAPRPHGWVRPVRASARPV